MRIERDGAIYCTLLVEQDAIFFGCEAEVENLRSIISRGTSADRQIACYNAAKEKTGSAYEALQMVVDELIDETVQGVVAG